MRNEGPFIVEWVTWYRMLGFSDVVVVTNNCTDRSPDLLDALQAAGWVHHIRHDITPGLPVTARKLAAAKGHVAVRRAEWVLVCDVDEFLVIHRGAGKLPDLLAPHIVDGVPQLLGMAINWRVFGTDGRKHWVDGPVHRQFFGALGRKRMLSKFVKTLFRAPKWFGALGEHGPRRLSLALSRRAWGDPGMAWVTAAGDPVPQWHPNGDYLRTLTPEQTSHAFAQINHYMLRSDETFSLKKGTLSPVARTDRYNGQYYAKANHADVIDDSAMRHEAEFDALFSTAMALPDVARLHHLCCADHLRLIAERAGRRVEDDPRHAAHLTLAEQHEAEKGGEFPPRPDQI